MSLDYKQVITPDSFFWPGHLWFWNEQITEDECIKQLREMRDIGVRNVWIIPLPSSFRPKSMETGLEPAYLSPEYLSLFQKVTKAISDYDMKLWLYDEAGWPSGSVCGEIVRRNPQLASQYLYKEEISDDHEGNILIPQDCLAAFLYIGNEPNPPERIEPGTQLKLANDIVKVEIVGVKKFCTNDFVPPYPDLLNPDSSKMFIDMTHEVYKTSLGSDFGKTIPIMLTDEPGVQGLPWTDDFETEFARDKGYDIKNHLYALFNDGDEGRSVRIDYFDWWSKRLTNAFFLKIKQWCNENSLLFIGHLSGEDITIGSRIYGYGHILRILRTFDIPGVDTIWKQIFPGEKGEIEVNWGNRKATYPICSNHHFPKFASSVAHQEGRRWSWTESFSAYGSSLTIEQMKWIVNFQYVRGINSLMACQRHYSMQGHYMGSMRPFLSSENPQYRHLSILNSYIARLSYLLSIGRPSIEIAVYLPVHDIWAGGSKLEEIAGSNDRLAKTLLDSQCDFDMIDDDVLEAAIVDQDNCCLIIGDMRYKMVCISKTEYITSKSVDKLNAFIQVGGRVLLFDNAVLPGVISGCINVDNSNFLEYLEPTVSVKGNPSSIKVCKRTTDQGNLYFLINEDSEEICFEAEFNETKTAYLINPETSNYTKLESISKEHFLAIPLALPFAGSCFVLFTEEYVDLGSDEYYNSQKVVWKEISGDWYCRKLRSLSIENSRYVLSESAGDKYRQIDLGDWRVALGDDFSGDAEYSIEFISDNVKLNRESFIDLGNVKDVCEVELNGVNLGKRAWHPYIFNCKTHLVNGANQLRIVVTNTMANKIVTSDVFEQWPDTVLGSYHRQCLSMEEGNTSSGIFGPVRVGYVM